MIVHSSLPNERNGAETATSPSRNGSEYKLTRSMVQVHSSLPNKRVEGLGIAQPYLINGRVSEWSNVRSWKGRVVKATGGSNPLPSAIYIKHNIWYILCALTTIYSIW